jgi:uncharacterized protein Yka (UPF0111/DUF47 family)
LKFNHPGLDTTVTRQGTRLVIQNDIGTTDAHVLIVTIEGTTVNITHTDVHRARAKFFVDLFDRFPIRWSGLERRKAENLGDGGLFVLVTGVYEAETIEARDAFLDAVGSSLVFLIDWNKARKALRILVDNYDAIRLLAWGARRQVGHRAFLELGGIELISSAVRQAVPARIGFGERLASVLGREAALDFLKTVLRICRDALSEGGSVRLARDQIEADIIRRLERTNSTLFALIVQQAGLASAIAERISLYLLELRTGDSGQGDALAAFARRTEQKADRLVLEGRNATTRLNARHTVGQLIDTVEGVIDELEQAAFMASLLPGRLDSAILQPFADLSAAVVESAQAIASGADAAGEVAEGQRADFDDALAAAARVAKLEHSCDDAERTITAFVLRGDFDSKTSLAVLEIARALERASDRLAIAANLLHAQAMADLAA